MYPKTFSYTPAALSANGYANDVAYAAGGYALTATTSGDGLAHELTVLNNSATDHSAKTLTIVGTDADGIAQTLSRAAPAGSVSVTTTGTFWGSVTSVSISATTGADTFDIGWNGVAVGPTYPLDWRKIPFNVTLAVDIYGTINYGVEYCLESFRSVAPSTIDWQSHSVIVGSTADTDSYLSYPATGVRFKLNSVTAGATVRFTIIQG